MTNQNPSGCSCTVSSSRSVLYCSYGYSKKPGANGLNRSTLTSVMATPTCTVSVTCAVYVLCFAHVDGQAPAGAVLRGHPDRPAGGGHAPVRRARLRRGGPGGFRWCFPGFVWRVFSSLCVL